MALCHLLDILFGGENMRNWYSKLTLLTLLALMVAACGGSSTPAPAPAATSAPAEATAAPAEPTAAPAPTVAPTTGADVTLTIWADDTRTPVIEALGAQFTEEYGVGIVVQQVGFGDIRENFTVAAPAGEGPDIIIGAHDWLGELATSGLLEEIDLGDKEGDFSPAAVDAFRYNGVLYGLPYAVENVAFFYNKDIIETPPTTWTEVQELAAELEAEGVVQYGYVLQPGDAFHFMPIQTAFGGYVFGTNENGYDASDVGLDSEGSIAAAQWLEGMIADGHLSADLDWDAVHGLFESGEAAMMITGPWAVGRFKEAGVNYGIANLPGETEDSSPFLGVQGFMVSAFSKDPLLAQAFLTEFVATEEAMTQIFASGDRPPAHLGVLESLTDPDLLAFGEAGVNGRAMPAIPEMGAVWGAWGDAVTIIFQGQQDADEAFINAADQVRNAIAGVVVDEEEMEEEEMEEGMMMDTMVPTEACAVDLTGEELVIYQQAGREGPLAAILGQGFAYATEDAVNMINSEGGICGATVRVVFGETNYAAEQEVAVYEQFRAADPKPFIVLTYGSAATIVLKDRVFEDKVVNLAAGLEAAAIYDPAEGYTVGLAPIYPDQFAGYLQWLSDNWADVKPADAGDDIVVGVIGWPNAFGFGAITAETEAFAAELGITLLPLEQVELSPTADVSGAIQNLVVSGANVIWNQSLSFTPAQVVGTTHALGLWDSVKMSGVNWSMHDDVPVFLGANPQLMDGYCGVFPYAYWSDTDVIGIQAADKAFTEANRPETDRSTTYVITFASFLAIRDVLIHTVNEVGSADITGEDVMTAMIDLGTISGGDISTYNVDETTRSSRMAQIRCVAWDGSQLNYEVVQDFFELPDMRPAPQN
jgi:maltose-binding protein MalE